LEADRQARWLQRPIGSKIDLTSFRHVYAGFANSGVFQAIPVPERTMSESMAGAGQDKDKARKIESFADLW
jgi:hypothetical protein